MAKIIYEPTIGELYLVFSSGSRTQRLQYQPALILDRLPKESAPGTKDAATHVLRVRWVIEDFDETLGDFAGRVIELTKEWTDAEVKRIDGELAALRGLAESASRLNNMITMRSKGLENV